MRLPKPLVGSFKLVTRKYTRGKSQKELTRPILIRGENDLGLIIKIISKHDK